MLPQAPEDGDGGSWAEIERLARLAEEGGANSLWVCDHFLHRTNDGEAGYHEPFTLLTAIAAVTERVQVGPLVAATSFRSVALLAKTAATLDSVADGRLILGLGCGWHEPEYRAFGYPFDHRVGRLGDRRRASAAARRRTRHAVGNLDPIGRRRDPAQARAPNPDRDRLGRAADDVVGRTTCGRVAGRLVGSAERNLPSGARTTRFRVRCRGSNQADQTSTSASRSKAAIPPTTAACRSTLPKSPPGSRPGRTRAWTTSSSASTREHLRPSGSRWRGSTASRADRPWLRAGCHSTCRSRTPRGRRSATPSTS